MGEAKRRKKEVEPLIYHHTSTLRTNQIWMRGFLLREGSVPDVMHPSLGRLSGGDGTLRRGMKEFPPLVWFTSNVSTPHCLRLNSLEFTQADGLTKRISIKGNEADFISLNRFSLGFRPSDIGAVRWADHHGYNTEEGRVLNETAIECGDNPDEWYVCDSDVDVLLFAEARCQKRLSIPKLEKTPTSYHEQIRKMVSMCKENPSIYIPPSWMHPDDTQRMARNAGIAVL